MMCKNMDGEIVKNRKELGSGSLGRALVESFRYSLANNSGMELVQAGLLIAIAIIVGLIFKDQIIDFVENTLDKLSKF